MLKRSAVVKSRNLRTPRFPETAKNEIEKAKKTDSLAPYPASWQNRFFDAVGRSPIPKLLVFILIFLGFFLLDHLVPWLEGKLPWGELDAGQLSFHIWLFIGLFTFDYFISYSKSTMARFRPALDVDETEYERLSYRFITLSSRTGWLLTLMAVPFAIVLVSNVGFLPAYFQTGWSSIAAYFSGTVQGSLFLGLSVFLYRAFRMIRQLYDRVESVNLFHLEPIYAFSGFTVRVGMFFVLSSTLGYLTNTIGWFLVFTISLNLLIAIAAFIWPLGGMHAKLQAEKERVNEENDLRLNRTYKELHQRIDKKNDVGMGDFRSRLSALLDLRQEIKKISTWPWDSATLRTFITALFVPITVWLIQQVVLNLAK